MAELRYIRTELAKQQLETALALFLDESNYAAAITLAGAAEEVLCKALTHRCRKAALEWKFGEIESAFSLFKEYVPTKKTFFEKENRVRNALKHFNAEDEEMFSTDLEEAACWMLVRAYENAHRLNSEIDRWTDFEEWLYVHMVGI